MNFLKYDLGQLKRGQIVEVTLSGNAANVQLLDYSNLQNYINGRRYTYHGGLAKKSPIRISVPSSGHWFVTVDMRGLGGTTNASVRVLPSPLPEIVQQPLSSIPSLYLGNQISDSEGKKYDVFISHASEDKDELVRPLALELQKRGLSVWYDEFEMKIGDSLRRKIDKGLANSKFGVVVLSRAFILKGWTNYELDGIITKAISGEQIILPIWHNITKKEVIDFSPSLADKLARNTSTNTIDEIADEIRDVIKSH
jgi:hypothetical protein